MFDIVRRRSYDERRILIDSARVLDSPFDDALVYLSGAQLELLRNLTQYLHRQDTYVATYFDNHYLTPDLDAWDAIQAIVADLEETLMGNPNTIWGYYERWIEAKDEYGSGTDDVYVSMTSVPAGEVWVLEQAYTYHMADSTKNVVCYAYGDGDYFYFCRVPALSPNIYERWQGRMVLSEGDHVVSWVTSPGDGKLVRFRVMGYKMKVP